MPAKLAAAAAWIAFTMTLAIAVAVFALYSPAGVALAQIVGVTAFDPPLGSHCACERGICPLDANGRRCSCGCAHKADAQPVQRLDSLVAATCTDGTAGIYPCRDIDLMAFLPQVTSAAEAATTSGAGPIR